MSDHDLAWAALSSYEMESHVKVEMEYADEYVVDYEVKMYSKDDLSYRHDAWASGLVEEKLDDDSETVVAAVIVVVVVVVVTVIS